MATEPSPRPVHVIGEISISSRLPYWPIIIPLSSVTAFLTMTGLCFQDPERSRFNLPLRTWSAYRTQPVVWLFLWTLWVHRYSHDFYGTSQTSDSRSLPPSMEDQQINNPRDELEAPSFMTAMAQLNQELPDSSPTDQPLFPTLPSPGPQNFGTATPPTLRTFFAQSTVMPSILANLMIQCQDQIAVLRALPYHERQEKNRLLTQRRAYELHHWFYLKHYLMYSRSSMPPEAFAKYWTDVQLRGRHFYVAYTTHLCLTFRINDLPIELLTEIFRLSVKNIRSEIGAVRFTHVCRLWRSIAINDRRLWNPVYFMEPKYFERSFTIMERAGTTNLDIRIQDNQAKPMSKDAMKQLIDRLFKKLPSIRKFQVFLYTREVVLPILETLQVAAQDHPKLELDYIELHAHRAATSGIPSEFLPALPLFIPPSLRHLRLNGINIQWDLTLLLRLTTLDLRRIAMELLPSSAAFRDFLHGATRLERLILDGAGPRHEPSVPILPPITIPSLRILVLGGMSDAYADFVLSHFRAPNVVDFTIMSPMHNKYPSLISALTTSSRMPNIKILTLVRMPLEDIPQESKLLLGKWLESMPELTYLRIMKSSREIFDVLEMKASVAQHALEGKETQQSENPYPPICPKIVYFDWRDDERDIDHFIKFLAFRRMVGYPLKKVWLFASTLRKLKAEEMQKFGQAFEGGIVHISGHRTAEEAALHA